MKQKVFAMVMLVLAVGAIFTLNYKAMQTPGAQERMVSLIRDTPAYIFYPIYFGFMVVMIFVLYTITFGHKKWARMATKGSVDNAKKVALSLWRVDGNVRTTIDKFTVVQFRHLSWGRASFILPVRPGHPDVKKFATLHDGDTVEFEPLEQGMECALEHELCGFIRIKSIS